MNQQEDWHTSSPTSGKVPFVRLGSAGKLRADTTRELLTRMGYAIDEESRPGLTPSGFEQTVKDAVAKGQVSLDDIEATIMNTAGEQAKGNLSAAASMRIFPEPAQCRSCLFFLTPDTQNSSPVSMSL